MLDGNRSRRVQFLQSSWYKFVDVAVQLHEWQPCEHIRTA
jgi:hypothetical protein